MKYIHISNIILFGLAINHLRYIIREEKDTKIDLDYIKKIDSILNPYRLKNKGRKFYRIDEALRKLYRESLEEK